MTRSAPSVTTSKSTTIELELFRPLPVPWTPHAGQKKGVKFLLEHAAAGLLADPGVGKTSMVFAAFKILKKKGMACKMLVVAPLRPCYLVWPREQEKWLDFAGLKVVVLHGPKKQELLESDADIYVINPEGLDWLLGAERTKTKTGKTSITVDVRQFQKLGFDTLVVDELSKFKHPGSGRHKALKAILGTFARRWGLTGSPAANGLIDLFGECYILDMGRAFGPYITHFRSKYFVPGFDGFTWNLRRGAEKEIYDRIRPLVLRLDAHDYVDMPAVVNNKIWIDLPPSVRKVYDQLEEVMIARLSEKEVVTASNSGVASMKCRQVCNGGLYHDDIGGTLVKPPKVTREWYDLHDEKTGAIADLVDELQGSPLLVAYEFNHDLARLHRRFGKDTPHIGAGVSPKTADIIERRWNKGEIPLLFGHPQSMGHGLNLQGAGQHVAWHSLTYDYDLYDQFIRRVWRQGNKMGRVFVHHVLARNTVDSVIFDTLASKNHTQRHLLDALRKMRSPRK